MRILLTNDGRGRANSCEASIHIEVFDEGITSAHLHACGATEDEARAALKRAMETLRAKLGEAME